MKIWCRHGAKKTPLPKRRTDARLLGRRGLLGGKSKRSKAKRRLMAVRMTPKDINLKGGRSSSGVVCFAEETAATGLAQCGWQPMQGASIRDGNHSDVTLVGETNMLRRNLVTLAAAVPFTLLATRAFAQEAPTPATRSFSGAEEASIGEAEAEHTEQTGMVGSLSLLQSRLAISMASDEKVKQFADWEIAEQETVGDILKSMKMGMNEAQGALQPPTDEEAKSMAGAEAETKLAELEALSGAEFDRAYVSASLEGHRKLLAIQEDYLTAGTNREHLSVAKLARGQITEHIAHLEELQSMLA